MPLLYHSEKNCPQLAKVRATYHCSFSYITRVLRYCQHIPLFLLRYCFSAHSFRFAIYSAASYRYQTHSCALDSPARTPQEALDTACICRPLRAQNGTLRVRFVVVYGYVSRPKSSEKPRPRRQTAAPAARQ